MLILTRRIGESIIIDGDVKIQILGMKNNHVRLGIEAPEEVTVHREEIHKLIQKEQGKGDIS